LPVTVDIFDEKFLQEPPDLHAGEYSFAIAIVGEHSTDPIVRLAIKGRDQDGWYPLSEIVVRQ
jgi:hypothetical protein